MGQDIEKLKQRIKELEIELRHLRNDYELTREEGEIANSKYLELYTHMEEANKELSSMNRKIEAQKTEIDNQYRLFRTLIDEIPIPVFYKDAQGVYQGCNKAYCKAVGITQQQVEGKSVYDLYARHEAEVFHRMDDQLLRQGGIQRYETRVMYADGEEHDVVVQKAAYSDSEGELVGIVAICNDVTDRKAIEHELRQTNRAKDKFFSIISHDMKNPLNALMLTTEFLQGNHRALPEGKIEELLGNVHSSAKRLNALLSNLLQWARSQSGRIPFEPTQLDLHHLVLQVLSLSTSNAREKDIELVCEVPADTLLGADRNMLMAILRNLVSNAVKFTTPGGRVVVAVEEDNDWIDILVSDTGIGIKKEDIEKIFRIDVHFTTKGTHRETGSGLGLILCREFVERHGGQIIVSSEPGKGSTFRVRLPLQPSEDI